MRTLVGAGVAVPAALGAAGAFSLATALQHRVAAQTPDAQGLRPREVASFVRATLAHRVWMASMVADVVGLSLHVLALRAGALLVVQTLLVTGVVFALVLNRLLDHRSLSGFELAWSIILIVALAGFLYGAGLSDSSPAPPDPAPASLALALGGVFVLGCGWVARAQKGSVAPAVLGTAAGVAFAGTAALIKECLGLLGRGPLSLLTRWPLYALLAVGLIGLLLNQLAFQAGPLRASLPALTIADVLASIGIGVWVFDEPIRHSAPALGLQLLGLVIMSAAAFTLIRRTNEEPRLLPG